MATFPAKNISFSSGKKSKNLKQMVCDETRPHKNIDIPLLSIRPPEFYVTCNICIVRKGSLKEDPLFSGLGDEPWKPLRKLLYVGPSVMCDVKLRNLCRWISRWFLNEQFLFYIGFEDPLRCFRDCTTYFVWRRVNINRLRLCRWIA